MGAEIVFKAYNVFMQIYYYNLHDNKYLYSFEEVVLLVLYGAITSSLRT